MDQVKDMNLLDWFAGQALVGLLSNPTRATTDPRLPGIPEHNLALLAYQYAESMVQARAERKNVPPAEAPE
ncbi:MAG: hypothetical protein JO112_06455 [Planctomycetes bacterium]|nr:hypothetical protein [Planctomycetota bacterium]